MAREFVNKLSLPGMVEHKEIVMITEKVSDAVGSFDDTTYEIISGIQKDEEVIVVGKDKVTDKSEVQVK